MAIVAYVGRTGSGKTYGVVENVILPAIKAGRTVVTNVALKIGYLDEDFPGNKIIKFDTREPLDDESFFDREKYPGALWVIDEAWRYWKAGTTAKAIPEIQQSFFTEHRHVVGDDGFTNEIVLVTQQLDQVAAFCRDLVEDTYRSTKLTALGTTKRYRVDVFLGCQKGLKGGDPTRQMVGTYKEEVYKYYYTNTSNKTDFAAGMEEKVDDRNNIWKSPLIKYGMPVAALVIAWSVSAVLSFFTRHETPTETTPDVREERRQAEPEYMRVKQQEDTRRTAIVALMESLDFSQEYLPLSESHRIVGEIGDTFLIAFAHGNRFIPKSKCSKFPSTDEDFCVYDRELVTWYSSFVEEEDTRSYLDGLAFGESFSSEDSEDE